MSQTLREIAQALQDTGKKVQLIYAFNGTGKTRLSREFRTLIDAKVEPLEKAEASRPKILYYNAFTEDLFYWDNNLSGDTEPKLKIQPNAFTDWILVDQGQDQNIITNFQKYVSDKLTPAFNQPYQSTDNNGKTVSVKAFSEVTFSMQRGDDARSGNIKISKAEESLFVWNVFYTLLDQVISVLNVAEPSDRETDGSVQKTVS